MLDELPVIALTIGDPAGIGPEVVLKALADPALSGIASWVVVGDARVIDLTERATGMPLSVTASLFSGAVTIASAPPVKQS